jgi:hypothetical protein
MQSAVMLGGIDDGLLSGGGPPPPRTSGEAVKFYKRAVKDEALSAENGRPVHVDREYITIQIPGDKTNVVDRPVMERDTRAYAQQYAAFKAGDSEQVVGTPLSQWPRISAAQVEDLKFFKVRTVEELAATSDNHLGALGIDGRRLRDEAKAWLEAAKGTAPIAKLQAQLEARDNELAALKQQMADLQKALNNRKEK